MHQGTRKHPTGFEVCVLWYQSCVPEGVELICVAEILVFIWGGSVSNEKTECSTFPYILVWPCDYILVNGMQIRIIGLTLSKTSLKRGR